MPPLTCAASSTCADRSCRSWIWPNVWAFRPPTPRRARSSSSCRSESQIIGLLVDAVSDILTQSTENIQPTPDVASDIVRLFVRGVLAVDGRMIGLIELDNLMSTELENAA